jgi:selenocysteine lyase/cysteine desulfurase
VLVQPLADLSVLRLSFQGYNTETDVDRLVEAVADVFG